VSVCIVVGLAVWLAACGSSREIPRNNVVLVILDTVRADHLSAYGYSRPTTPNFDRLARDGELYFEAYAQSPWTLPSIATILTGQPPHIHGARRTPQGLFGIRDDVTTLAERMAQARYRTAAFVNVVWCSAEISSLDRGFELYDLRFREDNYANGRDARETTDAALDWVRSIEGAPFFLTVHYFDPHLTYDAPPPFDTMFEPPGGPRISRGFGSSEELFKIREGAIRLDERRRESLIARYDGELRFVDEQFGRLRQELEELGQWEHTLVVVVADHGEEFWDHGGFEHGHTHYDEVLRVPLIVRRPVGRVGLETATRVRQLDIAPTILDFAGLPPSAELPGRVLRDAGSELAVAEGSLWAGDLVSVRGDRGTVILNRDTAEARFFGPDDRHESHPGESPAPGQEPYLELLRGLPPPGAEGPAQQLSDAQRERLRSLGYLR
jgi:arylsulfatase A-like enzyme